jgi:hypothetical protein
MEVPNTVTPTQLALICVLFSFLLAWMVTSLWLALRPEAKQQIQREEIRTPLQSPQIHTVVPPTQPIIAQVQLHTPSIVSEASREVSLKRSQ